MTPSVLAVHGIEKLSAQELRDFVACADSIGVNPDWLACVCSFETGGSFSPSQRNKYVETQALKSAKPYYGAVGLIQFMPETCASIFKLDRSVRAQCEQAMGLMASMTFAGQLTYVERYFAPYKNRMKSLEDCYLAVFYPAAIGRSDDYVLGRRDAPGFLGRVYEQNAGFDGRGGDHKDGLVTRGEVCATIRAVRDAAQGRRVIVAELPGGAV